jgi:hypothetical protein
LAPLARRRTGVKNSGGTARDVVIFLVRLSPRISLTPGTGLPQGPFIVARLRHVAQSKQQCATFMSRPQRQAF